MQLRKYHGLGNDYLVLEEPAAESLSVALSVAVCDRYRGPGGDGILLPIASSAADYGVRIYNPDGSEAEKSGNGLRIYARWLVEQRGAPDRFTVETLGGVVSCVVTGLEVEVEMGRAAVSALSLGAIDRESDAGMAIGSVFEVSVGNPHCPLFTAGSLDSLPWRRWGEAIEHHPRFPNRTNVQFARILAPDRIEARIWERGAGETQASGSSACAIAAAAVSSGQCPPGPIRVEMPGGTLYITVSSDLDLTLRGPVAPVCEIRLDERWHTDSISG